MFRGWRRLNPLSAIFVKELRVMSRRRRTYLLRFAYLGVLLLFLFGIWSANRDRFGEADGITVQLRRQSDLAEQFFALFAIFSTVAMSLVGPVLTCSAISAERLARTFDVLLMTPLNAFQIVAGKLASRLLVAFTLLGLSVPLLAIVRLLGGIEVENLFGAVALSAGAVTSGSALGLMLSCLSRRSHAVILLSYGIMLIVLVLLPATMMFWSVSTGTRGSPSLWATWMLAMNPVFSAGVMISPIPAPLPHWSTVTLVHLGAATLLMSVAALLVRRLARKQWSDAPVVSNPVDLLRSRPRRDVSDNPVRWRELRRPLLARPWQRLLAVVLTIGLLLFSYHSLSRDGFDGLDEEEVHIAYSFLFTGLFWLISTVLSATAVAHERESDTWTLLIASPLSGRKIILGKLFGVLLKLRYPMLIPLAHLLFVGPLARGMTVEAGLAVLAVMVCFNLPWIAIGMVLSVLCRRVTTAVVLSLLIPLGVMIGTPLLFSIVEEVTDRGQLSRQSLWIIPYYWQSEAIEHLGRGGRLSVEVLAGRLGELDLLVVVGLACLGHLVVAAAILWQLVAHFDRIVGRSPQREPLLSAPAVAPRRVARRVKSDSQVPARTSGPSRTNNV